MGKPSRDDAAQAAPPDTGMSFQTCLYNSTGNDCVERKNQEGSRPLFSQEIYRSALSRSPELKVAGSDASFVFRFEIGTDGRSAKVRTFHGCTPPEVGVR